MTLTFLVIIAVIIFASILIGGPVWFSLLWIDTEKRSWVDYVRALILAVILSAALSFIVLLLILGTCHAEGCAYLSLWLEGVYAWLIMPLTIIFSLMGVWYKHGPKRKNF